VNQGKLKEAIAAVDGMPPRAKATGRNVDARWFHLPPSFVAAMLKTYPQNGLAYVARGTANALLAKFEEVLFHPWSLCLKYLDRHSICRVSSKRLPSLRPFLPRWFGDGVG
jgi:hypothetical protein